MRPKSLPFAIGLFLFSIYLLSFSGNFHVMDELAVFSAGHNLAGHGRADINQLIWTNHWTPNPPGIWGEDGNLYTKKPPGISFIAAPLIRLGQAIPSLNRVHLALLTNTLITALSAALLFIWLRDLEYSRAAAALTSLGYGLCTFAWVYARMFWESSVLALAFLFAVWSVYRAVHLAQPERRPLWLLACGLALAFGISLRFEAALMTLFVGAYLVANWRRRDLEDRKVNGRLHEDSIRQRLAPVSSRVPPLGWSLATYLAPTLVIVLALLYFNLTRFGSLFETGYSQEISFREPWVGAFGLLLSPGRGLFFYAPLMALLFFGLRPAWRRLPRLYFWLIVTTCVCYWLFYGAWFAWGGTWGWGPRFLLPILPLLMLFVAEPLEGVGHRPESGLKSISVRMGVGLLALLSLLINLLGIVVDFNQHFSRLGSNASFVFDWAEFPPLAHWRILQEGLIDLIWLRPQAEGLAVEWSVLLPSLGLFGLATANLIITSRSPETNSIDRQQAPRTVYYVLLCFFAASLTLLTMIGTARVALAGDQDRFDLAVLDTLAASAQSGDVLLVAMPPFGDVQEISTRLMAYLGPSLPTYAWIESGPRAIQPDERARVWGGIEARAERVWVLERWLTPGDSISQTANRLNQEAFPIWEGWFTHSGRLGLYTLADDSQPAPNTTPLGIPFEGGLTLVDFAVWNEQSTFEGGDVVKLRLTWQAMGAGELDPRFIPVGGITAFVQLLDQAPSTRNIVQNDRLLVDIQNLDRSPLGPGQMLQQGYGLSLPGDLAPGSYPLIVGLYHTVTGQRLLRADGSPDDFVYLTDITVEER